MTLLIVRSIKNKLLYSSIAATAALSLSGIAQAEGGAAPGAQRTIDEVTIIARRREENAQETPVSVTALDSDALYKQNITAIGDLTSAVPGVNFTSSGGANNTVFSIRGRSRGVFGNALPAVTTYVNEVPLSTWGGNIPTYDISSVQVLKGPQGTLFGRNSTAGAVLINTAKPSFEQDGYGMVKIGDYHSQVLEGALNVTLIENKVALRIAGQTDKRHGHTENVLHPASDDYGNHDRKNYRISLLIEPNDSFSNVLVYEKNKTNEKGAPIVSVGYEPGGLVDFVYGPAMATHAALQETDLRKAYTDIDATLDQELNSVNNTTTWDVGGVTIKNIFGYREVFTRSLSDIDGTPFPMVNTDNTTDIEQFSNELQISGDILDGAMEYIGGLFWLKSQPNGGNRLVIQAFNPAGTPITTPAPGGASGPSDYYTDTSKAVFGQVSLDFGAFTDSLAAVSVDLGVRHTKDKTENCPVGATHITAPIPTEDVCTQNISKTFEKTTYNIGLNFQATDDLLLYAVTRTGYRSGGLNSPKLGGTLVPFQGFEPETVKDYEIGLKSDWSLGNIVGRFNLAYFDSEYEDVHYAIPTISIGQILGPVALGGLGLGGLDGNFDDTDDPTGGIFYSNSGDAKVKGVEAELIVQPTESTTFSFAGSYITKKVDVIFQIPTNWSVLPDSVLPSEKEIESFIFLGSPRWSYNIAVEHNLPVDEANGEVSLSARYFRMAELNYGGNIDADEYETVAVRADWLGVMGSSYDVAFYVSNLFDKTVILGPSSSTAGLGNNSAIFNDPRMWGASVRYNF